MGIQILIFFFLLHTVEKEIKTKKQDPIIKTFIKLENRSFINVFENTFTVSVSELNIKIAVIINNNIDILKIKL